VTVVLFPEKSAPLFCWHFAKMQSLLKLTFLQQMNRCNKWFSKQETHFVDRDKEYWHQTERVQHPISYKSIGGRFSPVLQINVSAYELPLAFKTHEISYVLKIWSPLLYINFRWRTAHCLCKREKIRFRVRVTRVKVTIRVSVKIIDNRFSNISATTGP